MHAEHEEKIHPDDRNFAREAEIEKNFERKLPEPGLHKLTPSYEATFVPTKQPLLRRNPDRLYIEIHV